MPAPNRPRRLLAAMLLVSGCASTSLPVSELRAVPVERLTWKDPVPGEYGSLVIARDGGFAGSAARVFITVDGKSATETMAEEVLRLKLPPGRHVVTVQSYALLGGETHRPRSLEVTVEAGKETLLRIGFDEMAKGLSLWQAVSPQVEGKR